MFKTVETLLLNENKFYTIQ